MTKIHAIQNADCRIYEQTNGESCIGHLVPINKWNITFHGKTPEEVREKIDAFIADTVEKFGIDEAEAAKRKGKKVSKTVNEEPELDTDDEFEDLLS